MVGVGEAELQLARVEMAEFLHARALSHCQHAITSLCRSSTNQHLYILTDALCRHIGCLHTGLAPLLTAISSFCLVPLLQKSSVVNHTIVTDPTIQQPGFYLPRYTWSLMNRFQTGQGPHHANLHIRGLTQSPSCDCGQ